jgi:type I restriction enzyme M protein
MKTMSKSTRQKEIERTLSDARDILRGFFEPYDCLHCLISLLFLRHVSDANLDQMGVTNNRDLPLNSLLPNYFVLPPESNFWCLYKNRELPGNAKRLDQALDFIEGANTELTGVFQESRGKFGRESQGDKLLQILLVHFAQKSLDLREHQPDIIPPVTYAFEFLLTIFVSSIRKTGLELLPPDGITDLLARLIQPKVGDRIYDPTCGSGAMLLRCAEIIQEQNASGGCSLYGQEINHSAWEMAKLNMILHRINSNYILCGDTLRNPMLIDAQGGLMHFDIVLGNPPFSIRWMCEDAEHDRFKRFSRGVPPRSRADYAFILHMIESLDPESGRMAIVVPHGVLFRSGSEGVIRQSLIKENLLDAVIGLPSKLFAGTAIPIVILIFRKNKLDKNVIFIDGSNDFESNKIQHRITSIHIERILNAYNARQSINGYANVVSLENIQEKGYNLNIPQYVHVVKLEDEIDIFSVRAERMMLKAKLANLETQMECALRDLK